MHYFQVEPWQQNLNLFGVLKQLAECVVLPFIVRWDYLVCAFGEFLDVLEQSLKSDWVCSSHSVLLRRAVEKDEIWVHKFSELFITGEFLINLAPRNLFILLLDLELSLCKLFPHKNNRNILLFRFPFIKCLHTCLNNTFPTDILRQLFRLNLLQILNIMLSRIFIQQGRLTLFTKGKIPNRLIYSLVYVRLLHFFYFTMKLVIFKFWIIKFD